MLFNYCVVIGSVVIGHVVIDSVVIDSVTISSMLISKLNENSESSRTFKKFQNKCKCFYVKEKYSVHYIKMILLKKDKQIGISL